MQSNATMTPAEALQRIKTFAEALASAKAAAKAAKDNLDDGALASANAQIAETIAAVRALAAVISDETEIASDARIGLLIKHAAELTPAAAEKLIEATRAWSGSAIVLPPGKYEGLSRGRGWCRLGTGDSAHWAERVEGGYRVDRPGKWTVGSTDGFKRKDSTPWAVQQLCPGLWIAD